MGKKYILEIATTDFESTMAAVAGGADRIELCSALSEGGLTPTYGTIKLCRQYTTVPLFPIIRPRAGDFCYTDNEFAVMLEDVAVAKEAGCDGIVVGILNEDGTIDRKRNTILVKKAYPLEVTFHRAFDRCVDAFAALEQLIDMGCTRLLTSGQQRTAIEGAALIKELIEKADDRIVIMPGSGVRKENINQLVADTGAIEFHSSLRSKMNSKMQFIHPAFAGSEESFTHAGILTSEVQELNLVLQKNTDFTQFR